MMMWQTFDLEHLLHQYDQPAWDTQSGLTLEQLQQKVEQMARDLADRPRPIIKAEIFAMLLREGQIDVDPKDFFSSRLNHGRLLIKLRGHWINELNQSEMKEARSSERLAWRLGAYRAEYDFGHTAPDWSAVLQLGVPGLLERARSARQEKLAQGVLTEEQQIFYEAIEIVYTAVAAFLRRLAAGAEAAALAHPEQAERMKWNASCLYHLSQRAPATFYEALQLSFIFHNLQEDVEGERVRSLGGMDRLYDPFYQDDLNNNRLTQQQAKTLIKYYFAKFFALTGDELYGQPLFLGGLDPQGRDAVNPLTWLMLQAADELALPNPKIHIRIAPETPRDFIAYCCDMIRRGNSSLVFINDTVAIQALQKTGVTLEEARDYVLIGCYEAAVMGREVPCTGCASLNLAKAVELVLFRGIDPLSGAKIGVDSGDPDDLRTFADFMTAVEQQLAYMLDQIVDTVNQYEAYYEQLNPSPLFSATMDACVVKGRDAYAGGAQYNNSSVNCGGLGSAVDSLAALDKLVFTQARLTVSEMSTILEHNWQGHELLRRKILQDPDKWGNNRTKPDSMARHLTQFVVQTLQTKQNARQGVYKPGLFSIDRCFYFGERMGATPDGRLAGQPISKNLSAVTSMDRAGVTALIESVTKVDLSDFANGSVLDILLHPSVVQGDEGLQAFVTLIETYFRLGGFAIHANVFDATLLKAAQENPADYANLQVRVCGWNVYFVNLSKQEQDAFIRQAEHAASI